MFNIGSQKAGGDIVNVGSSIKVGIQKKNKPTLEDLVSKTKQEISSEEEEVIRLHVYEILNLLGREDVSESIEKIIPDMDHDGFDNFNKVKDYIFTLVDVIRLSR